MKTTAIRLLCLAVAMAPLGAAAQKNIKAAFDAIINCPQAQIAESHNIIKDKKTKVKDGQDDVYDFVIPVGKANLIKNVWAAFDKDAETAYVMKKGRNAGEKSTISLYSSEWSRGNGISIDAPGSDYIYELFATTESEDPQGIHRYAYGFNCKEEDGVFKGRIAINYATNSDYRQKVQRDWQIRQLAEMEKTRKQVDAEESIQQSWFEMVMSRINGMADANQKTRIALATKIYELVKEVKSYPEVTNTDKNTIKNILLKMNQDPQYSDPVLHELLLQSQAALK